MLFSTCRELIVNRDWSDFFTTDEPNLSLSIDKYVDRQILAQAETNYVRNCFFSVLNADGQGGAIYSTSSACLIELCTFEDCHTSNTEGGAIYYKNDDGYFGCHMVCGYKCYITYQSSLGQFIYCFNKPGAFSEYGNPNKFSTVNDSSVVYTFCVENNGKYTLLLKGSNITVLRNNLTSNTANSEVAFVCDPAASPQSTAEKPNTNTFTLSYSSFVNNTSINYNCFAANVAASNKVIYQCNIIKNEVGRVENKWGLFKIDGIAKIMKCCLLENTCEFLLEASTKNAVLTLINCSIDQNQPNLDKNFFIGHGNKGNITQENKLESFVFAIEHLNTANCVAQYDAIGDIPTIEIIRNPIKKVIYTVHKYVYQHKYRPLTYLFL